MIGCLGSYIGISFNSRVLCIGQYFFLKWCTRAKILNSVTQFSFAGRRKSYLDPITYSELFTQILVLGGFWFSRGLGNGDQFLTRRVEKFITSHKCKCNDRLFYASVYENIRAACSKMHQLISKRESGTWRIAHPLSFELDSGWDEFLCEKIGGG